MSQVAERAIPVSAHVARYIAEYHGTKSASQPQWLAKTRESALESFERLGFPTTKLEEWRFTPVGPISEKVFSLATIMPTPTPRSRRCSPAGIPGRANGLFALHLEARRAAEGVQVLSLKGRHEPCRHGGAVFTRLRRSNSTLYGAQHRILRDAS